MTLNLQNYAWYSVVTLRDSCLDNHLKSLRTFYPDIPVYIVDNNNEQYYIDDICQKYNATVLKNGKTLLSLTENQDKWSKYLFEKYDLLCFSSDDIQILEGGFIEQAQQKIQNGSQIVSFSTDADPVAYMYDKNFFNNLGFNLNLKGKEDTDTDLVKRTKKYYGYLDSVGEYWVFDDHSWKSKYVLNPRLGLYGKTDVNMDLERMGLDSGRLTNRQRIIS